MKVVRVLVFMKKGKVVIVGLCFMLMFVFFAATMGSAAEKKAPPQVVKEIVEAMIRDGMIKADCLKESYNNQYKSDDLVYVTLENLSQGKGQQYLVEGMGQCTYGAGYPLHWIYVKSDSNYKLLADLGVSAGVAVLKKKTKGWKDIQIFYVYEGGKRTESVIYKFNGTTYKFAR
jgi:hypothetical protein